MVENRDNIIEQTTAIIWRQGATGLEFLLVQELDGIWSLPGGARDPEDETLLDAIKRELREELDLETSEYEITPTEVVIRFLYDRPSSSRYGKTGVLSLFLVKPINDQDIAPTADLKSVIWCNVQAAKNTLVFAHHKEIVDRAAKLISVN